MGIGIATYRALSISIVVLLIAAVVFATNGNLSGAVAALAGIVAVVLVQSVLLRCHHCGTRPGLWILAIWTLLLDPVLYSASVRVARNRFPIRQRRVRSICAAYAAVNTTLAVMNRAPLQFERTQSQHEWFAHAVSLCIRCRGLAA
jgi:hypothetical protein